MAKTECRMLWLNGAFLCMLGHDQRFRDFFIFESSTRLYAGCEFQFRIRLVRVESCRVVSCRATNTQATRGIVPHGRTLFRFARLNIVPLFRRRKQRDALHVVFDDKHQQAGWLLRKKRREEEKTKPFGR